MGRRKFDDKELDKLLMESLGCQERPAAGLVLAIKRQLRQGQRKTPSLWWLPALGGTALSAALMALLYSTATSWRCVAAGTLLLGVCTLSAWLITLFGYFKIKPFKEESRLI